MRKILLMDPERHGPFALGDCPGHLRIRSVQSPPPMQILAFVDLRRELFINLVINLSIKYVRLRHHFARRDVNSPL
jgi:hypothetical protein